MGHDASKGLLHAGPSKSVKVPRMPALPALPALPKLPKLSAGLQGLLGASSHSTSHSSAGIPVPAPGPATAPVFIYNSPDNDPSFQAIVAVPAVNSGYDPMWMATQTFPGGPNQIVIPRGSFALLPSTASEAYNLWLLTYATPSPPDTRGLQTAVALASTADLRYSLNDKNKQTALNGLAGNGAVFFRCFSATGQEVFVFGAINDMTGSGSGVGIPGVYSNPVLNLTWTNVNNEADFGLVQTYPPGFTLQSRAA